MHRFNLFICLASFTSLVAVHNLSDWDFSFLRIEQNTTDPQIAYADLRIIRSRAGEYAVNGSVVLGIDIDNTFSGSLKTFRSTGSSHYRETPYEVTKTSFYELMTYVYVKILQKQFSKCTNIPVYKDKFDTPLPKGTYYINNCLVTNDDMPGHMQDGLYKVSANFVRDNFQLWLTGFIDVKPKSLG